MAPGGERRASVFETVGAWLKIWTPPRDVIVPPVPVRKLLIGAGVLVVVGAALAAVLVPRIDASKDRTAAREARDKAARQAARRREVIAQQRPRRLRAADLRPPSGSPAPERVAARVALLGRAEEAITTDARKRAAAGELQGRPGATECEPYPKRDPGPEHDLSARAGVYDCLVSVRAIKATETNISGTLGYPFRAVVDFDGFAFTWCRTNPVPGERVVPDPRTVLELPKACRAT
jgi:hypothetical protein